MDATFLGNSWPLLAWLRANFWRFLSLGALLRYLLGRGVQFLSKAKVANMVDPLQSIVGSLS